MGINSEELWKAIVLFGLNQASYKMALGKVLLKSAKKQRTIIHWDELAKDFLNEYKDRLKNSVMPQQAMPGRLTKMERIISNIKVGKLSDDDAINLVAADGFNDVVPRFQTIGLDKNIIGSKFYEINFGKHLILSDNLLGLAEDKSEELVSELDARWGLLEGAFSINHSTEKLILSNNIREIFLKDGSTKRANLTDNVPFLSGYQGNTCFYCGEEILDKPHVDHVLPRQVVMHDNIWNLVLSHEHCNLQKSDKLVGEHFLKKLTFRNENIMGSNHPWKKKIANELGVTRAKRINRTNELYKMVTHARGEVYWGSDKAFDPSKDDFYKKFVTILNNGK